MVGKGERESEMCKILLDEHSHCWVFTVVHSSGWCHKSKQQQHGVLWNRHMLIHLDVFFFENSAQDTDSSNMSAPPVLYDLDSNGVATITLNRPARHNAYTGKHGGEKVLDAIHLASQSSHYLLIVPGLPRKPKKHPAVAMLPGVMRVLAT